MKKVLVSSLILLLLVGCGKKATSLYIETDAIKFKNEYESLNNKLEKVNIKENNPIVYSNIDEVNNIIENKSGLIYLGYPECKTCRDSVETLIEAAKQTGLKKIYYLNTKDLDINDSKYEKLKERLNDFKGIKVIFVKDKENIGAIESNDEDFKKMTEDEKEQLLKMYRNSIHEMLNDLCDQSC